jgi:hypothetical protein
VRVRPGSGQDPSGPPLDVSRMLRSNASPKGDGLHKMSNWLHCRYTSEGAPSTGVGMHFARTAKLDGEAHRGISAPDGSASRGSSARLRRPGVTCASAIGRAGSSASGRRFREIYAPPQHTNRLERSTAVEIAPNEGAARQFEQRRLAVYRSRGSAQRRLRLCKGEADLRAVNATAERGVEPELKRSIVGSEKNPDTARRQAYLRLRRTRSRVRGTRHFAGVEHSLHGFEGVPDTESDAGVVLPSRC